MTTKIQATFKAKLEDKVIEITLTKLRIEPYAHFIFLDISIFMSGHHPSISIRFEIQKIAFVICN